MSLVPSQYPDDAVELSVTFLIPVTDENRAEVDGEVLDMLEASPHIWWTKEVAHYIKGKGRVLALTYNRPPRYPTPKAPRRKAVS